MSGITSVQELANDPGRGGPIVLGVFGVLMLAASVTLLGILFLMGAVFWWFNQKSTYTVAIRTSAGELKVLTDNNGARVHKIVQALNDAIVYRN